MPLSTSAKEHLNIAALVIVGSLVAAILVVMLFSGNFKIVVAIVGALLGVAGLILSGNPRLFCLWGLLLTAPLELKKTFNVIQHMGGAGAFTIDAMDLFLVPLMVFLFRDFHIGLRKRNDFRLPKVLYWWLGLTALGILSTIIGPMRQVAALEVFRMIKLSLLFLVVVNEVVRMRQLNHVVAALMVSVFIQSSIGLIQYLFNINLGAQIFGEVTKEGAEFTSLATYFNSSEFTYRVGALIGHPNLLAIFLAALLPIGLAFTFTDIKSIYKLLILGIVSMGTVVLVLTLSRSGWLSFALAFSVLMGFSFIHPLLRNRYVMGRILAIFLIIIMAIALSGPIIKRLTQSDGGAVDFRWEWMEVAVRMALDKPILGFGLNSFVWFMPEYTKYGSYAGVVDKFGTDLPVVHNIYLLVWSEQGTLGLILFLGFHFHLIASCWNALRHYHDRFITMINLGCMAGILAVMTDGVASFFIRNGNCGRIFFIVIALATAAQYWYRENRQSPSLAGNINPNASIKTRTSP